MTIWTGIFVLALYGVILGFGDAVATKTKGLLSSVLVLSCAFLFGYWTNIIPTNALSLTNVPALIGAVGLPLIICNLGTMLNVNELRREWRTVVIGLASVVGIGAICLTFGIWIFGREYSLCAAGPISGGMIATIITKNAADAAGKSILGGYAMLVFAFQIFLGMPISAFLIKREGAKLRSKGTLLNNAKEEAKKDINLRFFSPLHEKYNTSTVKIAKVALVTAAAGIVANLTLIPGSTPANYYLNPNIAYLVFGIVFTAIGFLDDHALQKAGASGFLMFAVLTLVPGSFASITPAVFMEMLWPLVGMLIIGFIGIAIFSLIFGKMVGYSAEISIAIGCTALLGYPATEVVTNEAVKGFNGTDEEKKALYDNVLPKMLTGGFVTVTIASVLLAGIIVPMIF